jgi:hypothetical protein
LFSQKRNRIVFAAGLGLLFVSIFTFEQSQNRSVIDQRRNFYGVKKVSESERFRYLVHGGTMHGVYSKGPDGAHVASGYYARSGPFGDAAEIMHANVQAVRYGGIGLGVGGIAPYVTGEDSADFWELDPQIGDIAGDDKFFGFLSLCGARCTVKIGDGRLLLSAEAKIYDLLFVDAFSSDSIPLHLLTVEAIRLYMSKLSEKGIVLFNISNRYLDLSIPLARIAQELGLIPMKRADFTQTEKDVADGKLPAVFFSLLRSEEYASQFEKRGWVRMKSTSSLPLWTDDYSNLWQVFTACR